MCSTFWNDIQKNPGKVPHLQYTGSRVQEFKVGSSAIPEFTFVKWADKPADFSVEAPKEQSNGFNFNDNSSMGYSNNSNTRYSRAYTQGRPTEADFPALGTITESLTQ